LNFDISNYQKKLVVQIPHLYNHMSAAQKQYNELYKKFMDIKCKIDKEQLGLGTNKTSAEIEELNISKLIVSDDLEIAAKNYHQYYKELREWGQDISNYPEFLGVQLPQNLSKW
jgi:hypothetical protein